MGKSFPAISTFVWKELVHSLTEHFETPVNEPSNLNVNCLKIAKKHCRMHKNLSPAGRVFEMPELKHKFRNGTEVEKGCSWRFKGFG